MREIRHIGPNIVATAQYRNFPFKRRKERKRTTKELYQIKSQDFETCKEQKIKEKKRKKNGLDENAKDTGFVC